MIQTRLSLCIALIVPDIVGVRAEFRSSDRDTGQTQLSSQENSYGTDS